MDVSDVIKACGGDGVVAASAGVAANTVAHWRRRGRIPSEHWGAIVSLSEERQSGVTLAHLVALSAARGRRARASAPEPHSPPLPASDSAEAA
jgi:hypothetical protein